MGWLQRFDRLIALTIAVTQWLALPLIVLLFLQWPLRDIVHAYSSQANDFGQIIFALFVAVSVTAATRSGAHLAADTLAQRYSAPTRHWLKRIGTAVSVLPWAVFVFIASENFVVPSVLELESFSETSNPGYFLIKCALWLLAVLVIVQAFLDIVRLSPPDDI